jgi:hypothetical protein
MASAEMAVNSQWQPTPSSRYGKEEIITLLVGAEETEMVALASCISLHSEFFRTALKKEWAEGQTRTIKLPEEQPAIVAQYLDFTVGKGLPTDSTRMDPQEGEVYVVLARLYAFGERMLDSALRNTIIAEIIRFTRVVSINGRTVWPGLEPISTIYNCTTPGSPARRLMVDLYVHAASTTWFTDDMHPAFMRDLAEALMLQVQNSHLPCRVYLRPAEEYSF